MESGSESELMSAIDEMCSFDVDCDVNYAVCESVCVCVCVFLLLLR